MLAMFPPWGQQYPELHRYSSSTAMGKCCGQHKMYHPYETNQTILKYECIFIEKINIQIYSQKPLVLTYLLLVNQN